MFRKGSKLYSIFRFKCPKCHEGPLFENSNPYNLKDIGKMPKTCPKCNQPYSLEPGFYFGAAYVSYAMNVGWIIFFFLLAEFVWEIPYTTFLMFAAGLLIILTPILFRLSRAIWINFFVKYDPNVLKKTS